MELHNVAKLFPEMPDADFQALKVDIQKNGIKLPIILYQGKIVDGRHRYKAAQELGIECPSVEWSGDPWLDAQSLNLIRRHMAKDQVYAIMKIAARDYPEIAKPMEKVKEEAKATQVSGLKQGKKFREHHVTLTGKSSDAIAAQLGMSGATVERVDRLAREAPEILESLARGETTATKALREVIKEKNRERVKTLKIPDGKYRVVYADPPWEYGNSGVINDDNYGHVGRHYASMSIDALCQMPIVNMLDDNAVLFLWVTSPLLEDSFKVINAWGFKYKTSFVWDKVKHNFGHYNSVRHELLLVCTKGSCTPEISQLYDSVVTIERTKHSEKPEVFREIIDALYPSGNRIELFARKKIVGWETYGDDSAIL